MIEPEDVQRFRRHARKLGQLAAHDPEALHQAQELLAAFQQEIDGAWLALQAEGFSHRRIADALGVSRQAVDQRYQRLAAG